MTSNDKINSKPYLLQIKKGHLISLMIVGILMAISIVAYAESGSPETSPKGTVDVSGSSEGPVVTCPTSEECIVVLRNVGNDPELFFVNASNTVILYTMTDGQTVTIASPNVTLIQEGTTKVNLKNKGGKITINGTNTGSIENCTMDVGGVTYKGDFTISGESYGGIINDGSILTVTSSGLVSGSISNEGELYNSGSIDVSGSGAFFFNSDKVDNSGTITLGDTAQLINYDSGSTILNSGMIKLSQDDIVDNKGTIQNEEAGTIEALSFVDNSWIDASYAHFINYGTISAKKITILNTKGFESGAKAVYKASDAFYKADFDLNGFVEPGEDAFITSDGGTFTLRSGGKTTEITEKVEDGKIANLLVSLDPEIKFTQVGDTDSYVYYGSDPGSCFKWTVADGYDSSKVYLEYSTEEDHTFKKEFPTPSKIPYSCYVRAVAPADGDYKESKTEPKVFKIIYLSLEKCDKTLLGNYIDAENLANAGETEAYSKGSFTVKPASGYLVKSNLSGSSYKESIELSQSDLYSGGSFNSNLKFSLKRGSDGAETEEMGYKTLVPILDKIVFDSENPEFSSEATADGSSITVASGDEIKAKELKLSVSDKNLDKVVVSGITEKTYSREDGSITAEGSGYTAQITLSAVAGAAKEAVIYAYDKAGNESKMSLSLKMPLSEATAQVSVPDTKVGTDYEPTLTTTSDGKDSVKYEYKKKGEADSTYTTSKPVTAGSFTIRATVPETDLYKEVSCTADFTISRKTPEEAKVTVADTVLGNAITPVLVTDSDGKASAVYEYKKSDDPDSAYSSAEPSQAGSYTIRATIPETDSYEKIVCTGTFKIVKDSVGPSKVEVADTVVGVDFEPVLTTDSDGAASVVYTYKKSDAADDTYSDKKPTAAGSYTVKAVIPATEKFDEIVCTDDFTISKKTATASVSVPDTVIGSDYEPVLTTDSDGKDGVTFVYKDNSASGSTYTSEKPVKAGSYTVKAIIPATDTYEAISVESTFSINKKTATASVTQANTLAGVDYNPALTTTSDNAKNVKYAYKTVGVTNATYTVVKPILPGTYMVRATIPASDTYSEISCEAKYTISYLEAPASAYTLSGTKGDNGFYKSDVYLKAPDGFSISKEESGQTWQRLLPYDDEIKSVYLKRDSDGALTDKISVSEKIKIDKKDPALKKATDENGEEVTLKDGKTVYADEVEVKINDANLSKVTVNDKEVEFSGKTATLKLDPDSGSKDFRIRAVDKAGNVFKIKCTVATAWQKKGIVPSGKKVKLTKGKSYKLDSGKWKISGDSTVYTGGMQVYVKSTGEYTFTKE